MLVALIVLFSPLSCDCRRVQGGQALLGRPNENEDKLTCNSGSDAAFTWRSISRRQAWTSHAA